MANEKRTTQSALVTGGSRGIGGAITLALIESGFRTHFCGRKRGHLEEMLLRCEEAAPGMAAAHEADVRDRERMASLVAEIVATDGGLDCLVNNAGVGIFGPVDELAPEDWRTMIDTNLSGAFHTIHAAAPVMRRQGHGWIINIASLAGKHPFAGGAGYNASKFGLIGLSEAAMLDLRQDGVRVAVLLPGSVATDFGGEGKRRDADWMLQPEDVARAVLDLIRFPSHALPSHLELRPSKPPRHG